MNQNSLECVWKTELEIIDEIHRICLENNLKYSLAYGTLLGAVRHQGFIPWDDDIDIMMPREDYNKLLSIWNTAAKKEFIIQNKGVEPNFTQNFTKIRKNNTAYVQDDYELKRPYHTGIFVDNKESLHTAVKKYYELRNSSEYAVLVIDRRRFNNVTYKNIIEEVNGYQVEYTTDINDSFDRLIEV